MTVYETLAKEILNSVGGTAKRSRKHARQVAASYIPWSTDDPESSKPDHSLKGAEPLSRKPWNTTVHRTRICRESCLT